MKRKVCVVTSTRADYGLLYWTMKEIEKSNKLEFQLIVAGMHLSEKFGNTWQNIEKDGFKIDHKIILNMDGDSQASAALQMAECIVGMSDALSKLAPDIILILGDRYEMLAAAQTALIFNCPVAHIHGGEISEGAFDDAIRHSISKMSHLHFTSAKQHQKRVIQLGESPERTYCVGAPGLENIKQLNLLSRKELENSLKFKFEKRNFLVTYHPVTLADSSGVMPLIKALEKFCDCGQIVTMPNCDPGHQEIFNSWRNYAKNRKNVLLTKSLGQLKYLSTMKECNVVIGNSSSGIIEAPFMGVTTVNIGDRQKGRLSSESVLHCNEDEKEIEKAIKRSFSMNSLSSNSYGDGNTSEKIVEVLERIDLEGIRQKRFYDIEGINDN